jgi:prolyl-tRNA editing enzyme YbaK/EbsC (Cys-tRNA(Pro) deacylase)
MMTQQLGKLSFEPAEQAQSLLALPVNKYMEQYGYDAVWAAEIDASLADTAVFCEHYDIGLDVSANCVIVEAKRADKTWYAACIVLATTKVDVNGVVRKTLDARKVSFAPMDTATSLTSMEYGGITPVGLPNDWPILIDNQVLQHEKLIVGSGIRGSKLLITAEKLCNLANAQALDIAKA